MNKYIAETSKRGEKCSIGYFTVIEDDVVLGDNVTVGHNCVIHQGTKIGDNVNIGAGSIIGKLPIKAKRSATTKDSKFGPTVIGDGCAIGANVIIYVGAELGNSLLVADLATIREEVTIGDYTIVGRGAAIENECKIGKACKIETNAYITAYSELEDFVFISPAVATSNDNFMGRSEERFKHFKGVTVKRGGRIGVNATILPGKTIQEDAMVAAGSVVSKNVPPQRVVLGCPAEDFRPVPEEQLLDNQDWELLKED